MLPSALGNAGTLWKWLGAEPEERNHQKLGFWETESIKTKQGTRCWRAAPAKYKLKPNWQKHQGLIFFQKKLYSLGVKT